MKNWISKKFAENPFVGKLQEKAAEGSDWVSGKLENSELLDTVNTKINDGKDWAAAKLDTSEAYLVMQTKLASAIDDAFESIIDSKRTEARNRLPDGAGASSVEKIINRCAIENAAISGGIGLIPGPWGMVAVVPEIAAVIRKQIGMVYDIGVANGKEAYITKELLAGIVLSAVGSGATGLFVMHGSKILVKRTSLRVFQKIVSLLAGKVTQQALKSAISKWLPIVGAAFMAWFSGHMTRKIGHTANEFFNQEIELSDSELNDAEVDETPAQMQPESKPD
ncbi:MAG: hypothetical protein Q7T25_12795 [Sideroxyarcus sp.]|nr:hypothetical protein [Sideroxyarcus sp.]